MWVLYGWQRRATGLRRYRRAYVEIATKNGKTTIAGGHCAATCCWRMASRGRRCTGRRRSATRRSWSWMRRPRRMVEATPVPVASTSRSTGHRFSSKWDQASKCTGPLGRDSDTMDGLNVHVRLSTSCTRTAGSGVVGRAEDGHGQARTQALMFGITTAGLTSRRSATSDTSTTQVLDGDDRGSQPIMRHHLCAGRGGRLDQTKRTWIKANPNWGVSVAPGRPARAGAQGEGVAQRADLLQTTRLNIWTQRRSTLDSTRTSGGRAAGPSTWPLDGRTCYAGAGSGQHAGYYGIGAGVPAARGEGRRTTRYSECCRVCGCRRRPCMSAAGVTRCPMMLGAAMGGSRRFRVM